MKNRGGDGMWGGGEERKISKKKVCSSKNSSSWIGESVLRTQLVVQAQVEIAGLESRGEQLMSGSQ